MEAGAADHPLRTEQDPLTQKRKRILFLFDRLFCCWGETEKGAVNGLSGFFIDQIQPCLVSLTGGAVCQQYKSVLLLRIKEHPADGTIGIALVSYHPTVRYQLVGNMGAQSPLDSMGSFPPGSS